MSEQGWRDFLRADGLEDWVVLHGGPTAVFRAGSAAAAARLAVAVAEIDGIDGSRAALAVSNGSLTVKLTRELWGVEAQHIEIARTISALAREHGAVPDRTAVQEVQVAIAAKPDALDVGFWRAVLGYDTMAPDNGIDPLGTGSTFWMQDLDPQKPLRHAMHMDVSLAREEAERRVAAAVAAGGRIVEETNAPGGWILADRAGNKVCIAAWPDGAETPEWSEEATESAD
jgi:4a-hydroxytetrahydrobiopterin dehydratase